MPAPRSTLLRETPDAAPTGARVIDAHYNVVRGASRGVWGRIKTVLMAIFWAALIGFLIPPAWVLVQEVGAMLAPAP